MGLQTHMAVDLRNVFFNGNDFPITVTYTPKTGAAYSFLAIFDNAHQEMDPDTQVPVMGTLPSVRVNVADLRATPGPEDHMTIDSVIYRVRESQPDGTGTARILLTQE